MNKLIKLLLIVLAACSTTSCYFNSAGYFFQKAGYDATSTIQSVKPGENVMSDGTHYYVELERFRYGYPREIAYFLGDDEDSKTKKKKEKQLIPTGEREVFEIPADFAMYLTGKATSPNKPSFMTRVPNPEQVKSLATSLSPIVAKPADHSEAYKYKSSNAALWYTAGAFDWLCVDLPVTCVQNSLVIGYIGLAIAYTGASAANEYKKATTPDYSGSLGSGSSSSSGDDRMRDYLKKQHQEASMMMEGKCS